MDSVELGLNVLVLVAIISFLGCLASAALKKDRALNTFGWLMATCGVLALLLSGGIPHPP